MYIISIGNLMSKITSVIAPLISLQGKSKHAVLRFLMCLICWWHFPLCQHLDWNITYLVWYYFCTSKVILEEERQRKSNLRRLKYIDLVLKEKCDHSGRKKNISLPIKSPSVPLSLSQEPFREWLVMLNYWCDGGLQWKQMFWVPSDIVLLLQSQLNMSEESGSRK